MRSTRSGQGFVTGLVGGAVIGAVGGLLFAPQIYAAFKQTRGQLTDALANAGDVAADARREATARAVDAAGDLQRKGRGAYGKALGAVIRGAEDVKARATEAQAELDQRATDAARGSS